jgi:hypothetical protein
MQSVIMQMVHVVRHRLYEITVSAAVVGDVDGRLPLPKSAA